jgi:hypothetical protein
MMPNGGSRDLKSLGTNSIEARRELVSQKRHFYVSRQRETSASPGKPCNVKAPEPLPRDIKVPFFTAPDRVRVSGAVAADRRTAIKYVFQEVLLSPGKDTWLELGTIADIIHMLRMPEGS